jgi:hypothetical protein
MLMMTMSNWPKRQEKLKGLKPKRQDKLKALKPKRQDKLKALKILTLPRTLPLAVLQPVPSVVPLWQD